jgi:hypothetical protein
MRSYAGIANKQRDIDLHFAPVSALRTLAWFVIIYYFLSLTEGADLRGAQCLVAIPACDRIAGLHDIYFSDGECTNANGV